MLTYALYTAADWAPYRGLGPGPGRCITLLNDTECGYHQKLPASRAIKRKSNVHE